MFSCLYNTFREKIHKRLTVLNGVLISHNVFYLYTEQHTQENCSIMSIKQMCIHKYIST